MSTPEHNDRAYLRDRKQERQERIAEDRRIRSIAAQEVWRAVGGLMWFGLTGLIWHEYGTLAGIAVFVGGPCFFAYEQDARPDFNLEQAEFDASRFMELTIVAELHKAGELQWRVVNGYVELAEHPAWASLPIRTEREIDWFGAASPRDRRRRIKVAKKQTYPARLDMVRFAASQKAHPLSWWD